MLLNLCQSGVAVVAYHIQISCVKTFLVVLKLLQKSRNMDRILLSYLKAVLYCTAFTEVDGHVVLSVHNLSYMHYGIIVAADITDQNAPRIVKSGSVRVKDPFSPEEIRLRSVDIMAEHPC